jgi:hypothetical protein
MRGWREEGGYGGIKGGRGGKGGEMMQTLYAHMNERKFFKKGMDRKKKEYEAFPSLPSFSQQAAYTFIHCDEKEGPHVLPRALLTHIS